MSESTFDPVEFQVKIDKIMAPEFGRAMAEEIAENPTSHVYAFVGRAVARLAGWDPEHEQAQALVARIATSKARGPALARVQPCGCILCTCADDVACCGCGAKSCGDPARCVFPNGGAVFVASNPSGLEPAKADVWPPIETAPRDGTLVIVWPPTYSGATSCARFNDDRFAKKPRPYWNRSDTAFTGASRGNPPTHWRPVLSGPEGSDER